MLFAFDANDVINNHFKTVYGDYILMFKSSGIKVFNTIDRSYEVIFNADINLKNVVIIKMDEKKTSFSVIVPSGNKEEDAIFTSSSLPTVVKWVINNYEQYRKKINVDNHKSQINNYMKKYNQAIERLENTLKTNNIEYVTYGKLTDNLTLLVNCGYSIIKSILNNPEFNILNIESRREYRFNADYYEKKFVQKWVEKDINNGIDKLDAEDKGYQILTIYPSKGMYYAN